ncbi:MAG: ABC transporter permease, partial [Bacteroidota bacterium]
MGISFTQILKAEFQKTKNIWGLSLSILGPFAVLLIMTIGFISQSENASNEVNPWINLAKYTFQFFFFLYPLFAALVAFLLSNIEHKNRGFKQIFTLPAPKFYFYGSKVLILLFWILSS